MVKKVKLKEEIIFGEESHPFVLLAGPCVLESENRVLRIAEAIRDITYRLGIPFVFKSSFDKANRSSISSYRGPGLERGLQILKEIKDRFCLPLITDIHLPQQAGPAAEVVDIIQIPAFLSRQTDLILAAARTGKIVNVKKGQFLAPEDMDKVVGKIESTNNHRILLTERGTSFGYHNLVVDMRSLVRMRQTGYPVVFDATHSVQLPGAAGETSGGEREYAPPLARAAAGVGIDALFMEVHDEPGEALSDGANMIRLDQLEKVLKQVLVIDRAVKNR